MSMVFQNQCPSHIKLQIKELNISNKTEVSNIFTDCVKYFVDF